MIPDSGCYELTYVLGPPVATKEAAENLTVEEYRDLTLDEIALSRDGIGHVTITVRPRRLNRVPRPAV